MNTKYTLFVSLLIVSSLISCVTSTNSPPPPAQSVAQTINQNAIRSKIVPDHAEGVANSNGTGTAPYLKALDAPPPKVALVSVYIVDPVKKFEADNLSTAQWIELAHAKKAANQIFEQGFPAMKEQFAKHGMDLLAPADFLTDEKKKKFYKSFKLKHPSKPVRYAENFLWGMTHHAKTIFQPADGFGEIYLMSAESMRAGTTAYDKTLAERLGNDLTKGLDTNAVLIVLSQFTVVDGQTVHDETSMYMFGPNPVKQGEKSEAYQVGHKYAGIRAPYNLIFAGNSVSPDSFKGYGHLLEEMSLAMGKYLVQKTGFTSGQHE